MSIFVQHPEILKLYRIGNLAWAFAAPSLGSCAFVADFKLDLNLASVYKLGVHHYILGSISPQVVMVIECFAEISLLLAFCQQLVGWLLLNPHFQ